MSDTAPMEQAVSEMLEALEKALKNHLPEDPSISIISLKERALALGNSRGMKNLSSFSAVELKGGRLDALVRFQLQGNDPDKLEAGMAMLHGRMLAAKDELWKRHVLRFAAMKTSAIQQIPGSNEWSKTADYGILYEFHYNDAGGAESLILRIPIAVDSLYRESTFVEGEIVRWDDESVKALEARGNNLQSRSVRAIFMLGFLPGLWSGGEVSILAIADGHVYEKKFNSVRAFRDAFKWEKDENWEEKKKYKTIELGKGIYYFGSLSFPNSDFPDPIVLNGEDDLFRVSYISPAFDDEAVLYLRLITGNGGGFL